jgi:hypothetical protein
MHSALALFAQRTRIPTSARSIGFCVIWVCISSSSSTSELGQSDIFYSIILSINYVIVRWLVRTYVVRRVRLFFSFWTGVQ